MKYWVVTADYRPHNNNKPKYKFKSTNRGTPTKVKRWFNNYYSWLTIYNIEEITEAEYEQSKGGGFSICPWV